MAKKRGGNKRERARKEKEELAALSKPKQSGIDTAKRQLKSAAKVAIIAAVVIWVLALGFWSGLESNIPLYVAMVLTLGGGVGALLIRRNLSKSESMGALISGSDDMPEEERLARLAKLEKKAAKGDAQSLLAMAQLQMQDAPEDALATLEKVNLDKANRLVSAQVRAMRTMIHLNLGQVKNARGIADDVDMAKIPDPKLRGNVSAVVAEAWARSGNPIEATELLDKYDIDDDDFRDIRMQLLRARVFACAHKNDIKSMRRYLKLLIEISPQLAGMFVGQKRVHPLLQKEARRLLEKAGMMPRQKIMMERR